MSSNGEQSGSAGRLSPQESMRERLDRLEAELAALRHELRAFQPESDDPPAQRAERPTSASAGPSLDRPRPRAETSSAAPSRTATETTFQQRSPTFELPPLEELVGRYGMLALGALTVIVGAGIFMGWAIRAGLLGPSVRVVLGAMGSLALAYAGLRLRRRTYVDFGNVILALALAVMHVVCWSAGPLLHVVPSIAALAVAFVTALLLAEFALRNDEQLLFSVGFGGAILAPFVTSETTGSLLALAAYGVIVIGLACAALRDRDWMIARRLVVAAFALYQVAIIAGRGVDSETGGLFAVGERMSAIMFAIASVVFVTLLSHRRHRAGLLRVGAVGLAAAATTYTDVGSAWIVALSMATVGATVAILMLYLSQPVLDPGEQEAEASARERTLIEQRRALRVLDGFLIPALLMFATIGIVPRGWNTVDVVLAAGWSAALVVLTVRTRGESISHGYPFAASVAAIAAALWIPVNDFLIPSLVIVSIAFAAVHLRLHRMGFVAGSAFALVLASLLVMFDLQERPAFSFVPFATSASLRAAIVLVGFLVLRRLLRDDSTFTQWTTTQTGTMVTWGAAAFGFAWVHVELGRAFSPTAAFALLVGYYAVTGFGVVEWGRRMDSRTVRMVGLALCALAAGKALSATLTINSIGTRVGLLFGVSAFLIGVAFRYRRHLGAPTVGAA